MWVKFEDDVQGEINLADLIRFEGVFAALHDPTRVAEVSVHPELGSLHWPNGADLDSDVLYAKVSAKLLKVQEGSGRDDIEAMREC